MKQNKDHSGEKQISVKTYWALLAIGLLCTFIGSNIANKGLRMAVVIICTVSITEISVKISQMLSAKVREKMANKQN